jgi:hypothetical protein
MTAVKVGQKIQSARSNGVISTKEAKDIVAAAEQKASGAPDKVTNAEAKKVGELFEGPRIPTGQPGMSINPPPPHTPFNPDLQVGAKRVFNDFFIRHKLPYGENTANIKDRMGAILERNGLGTKMAKAPSTRSLHEVFLHDNRMVDGDRQDAFYDAEKNRFFVRAQGGGRANGPEARWYGPFDMAPAHPLNPPRPH